MCDTNVNYAEIALSIGSPTLGMFPSSVMMLGGDNIFIAGPCFEPSNVIVCEFPGGKMMNGSYISGIQASCPVPMLNMTGRLTVRMSMDGGSSFDYQGIVTSGK